MEHPPSEYSCVIHFNFQQLMEVKKAITDRIVTLTMRPDYDYKEQDLDSLTSINEVFDDHINTAIDDWEQNVANVESQELDDDEKLRKFLSDE